MQRTFATVLLTTSLAAAQSTWIVDKNNGAGTHFRSVQAAVDAAKAGDILEIRAGAYEGFTMTKGLRLLAGPGVRIDTGQGLFGKQVVIASLSLGETAVLRGFAIDDSRGLGQSVRVERNNGTVQFEHMSFTGLASGSATAAVRIEASLGVSFRQCDVASGIDVLDSAVMVTESAIRRISNPSHILASQPAIRAARARVTIAECTLQGEDGNHPYNTSQPAVAATASTIKITGTAKSTLRAGGPASQASSALRGDAKSTLILDPRPSLLPSGNASAHTGFGRVEQRSVTYLSSRGGQLGGSIDLAQYGAAGDFYVLFLGLPREPHPWPPIGHVWLSQATQIHLLAGLYDQTGQLTAKLRVPVQAGLRGLPVGVQVAAGPWPHLLYSNAVFVTLY